MSVQKHDRQMVDFHCFSGLMTLPVCRLSDRLDFLLQTHTICEMKMKLLRKISFGGIPNRQWWFCPCGQCYHQKVFKTITWLLLSRLQGNKPHQNSPRTFRTLPPEPIPSGTCLQNLRQHAPELSGTCLGNLHQHTPEHSGTFRNLPPEPTPAHTGTHRSLSGNCLRNLHRHTPAHTGAYPETASGTYTSTHPNSPEAFGTCLPNVYQHTPELSGTFRNLPQCSCDPHRHTPELIWAENPVSLRCWGKMKASWIPDHLIFVPPACKHNY